MRRYLTFLLVLGLGLLGGVAYAQQNTDEFTGCLTRGGALIRVAEGDEPLRNCPRRATEVSWNVQGPQGQQGVQGAPGEDGGLSGLEYVYSARVTIPAASPGNQTTGAAAEAFCPDGKRVVAGGHELSGPAASLPSAVVTRSAANWPDNSWLVNAGARDLGQPLEIQAFAICAEANDFVANPSLNSP